MTDRGIWEFSSPGEDDVLSMYDGEISITAHPKGVLIEVTEEKAVDSYNADFTCSALIPPEKVADLVRFLSQFIPQ